MNWRDQLKSWSPENQEFWRACLATVLADHPTWSAEFCELHAFRQIRDVLLSEGTLLLEHVPGWGATGRARTFEQIQALPRDDSQERYARNRAEWEARRRAADAQADNEPDEPRRQYAGGRR